MTYHRWPLKTYDELTIGASDGAREADNAGACHLAGMRHRRARASKCRRGRRRFAFAGMLWHAHYFVGNLMSEIIIAADDLR